MQEQPAISSAATICFWVGLAFCLSPWASPPVALAIGLALGLLLGHPYKAKNGKIVKRLLQASVVGLGFGMNISDVLAAGRQGIGFTIVSIATTLLVGYLLARALQVPRKTGYLISVGTAICGGSAIAAMSPVVDADERDVAVSLGTVFLLNAIALFLFPWAGHRLGMSQQQFGMWSAIAIHDTSSVVGAAAHYGAEALKIATTVKLTRALWILPLTLLTALAVKKKGARISFPWFIVGFVAAAVVATALPTLDWGFVWIVRAAKVGLTVTLYLIGAGLTRQTLRAVGMRPVVQGVILWAFISGLSLWAISHLVV